MNTVPGKFSSYKTGTIRLSPDRLSSRLNALAPVLTPVLIFSLVVSTPIYAGDILRGGAPSFNRSEAARAQGKTGSGARGAAASKKKQESRLARTTQTILDVQKMQESARKIAGGKGVPNGLRPGGLEVATGREAQWIGASKPKQAGNAVTIQQNQSQALLNWKTFNVGSKTKLHFDQSKGKSDAGKWVVFNKILDPSGKPSQVLGSIKAEGQVYVINQNGIIFGGGSQVNAHALVASSLPINTNLIARGLINNPDGQFLFSSIDIPSGSQGTPAFSPEKPLTANGRIGDVLVEKGAHLLSPTSEAKIGGRIALVGPNVENRGTIETPDGQTILAAGLQVGFAAHPSSDPSLRGLDVYVGKVGDYEASATNSGLILANRASVVMTGKSVNQLGVIESSTSVSLNGRIDLLADYNAVPNVPDNSFNLASTGGVRNLDPFLFLPQTSGSITIGKGSVTRILPERDSDEATVGTELPLRSQINLQGRSIFLDKNARILAPNAIARLSAGIWKLDDSNANLPKTNFLYSQGQVYIDEGAFLDVSGSTDVLVPVSQNILTLQLLGAELADSPLQRNGPLRGTEIKVDARRTGVFNGRYWVGTPLGDATGFLGIIERNAGELTTAGGSVEIQAGNSVVLRKGAEIDVSGGYVRYEDGLVETSMALYQGRLIDIANATPDLQIEGIYTGKSFVSHPKWGIEQTFTNPLALTGARMEQGYVQGAAAGDIAITAPSMALDGTLSGSRVTGPYQNRTTSSSSSLPKGAGLSLAFLTQDSRNPDQLFFSPTPPSITFRNNSEQFAPEEFELDEEGNPIALPEERIEEVLLSPKLLSRNGFTSLTIDNSEGDITVPENVSLDAAPGGAISLKGANIRIDGKVSAPGGSLTFATYNISPLFAQRLINNPSGALIPAPNIDRGLFQLGRNAVLDASGLLIDDRSGTSDLPMLFTGGNISISTYTADLAEGSVIDVSGGVASSVTGSLSYGSAGAVSILTGKDLNLAGVLGGRITLSSELRGFSGSKGGSLTVQSQLVQIGGVATYENTLLLEPDFFSLGGFAKFNITGLGQREGDGVVPGVLIAAGTQVNPIAKSLVARDVKSEDLVLGVRQLDVGVRTPVSLAFSAPGVRDPIAGLVVRGNLLMEEGSSISTDPLATIGFSSQTTALYGSATAPGGSITISGSSDSKSPFPNQLFQFLTTVYLGPTSSFSTVGTRLLTPDAFGRRVGTVLPGGTISVTGNIVAEAGSVLDVSGASGVLDLQVTTVEPVAANNSLLTDLTEVPNIRYVATQVDSNAGSITLRGGQALFSDATLRGRAGGKTALGGKLDVSSGRFYGEGSSSSPLDVNLVVSQSDRALAVRQAGVGETVLDAAGEPVQGLGFFAADRFLRGGFDSLNLGGNVQFSGTVGIEARGAMAVADQGVLFANSKVNLTASHVTLGTTFQAPSITRQLTSVFELGGQPTFFGPTGGTGRLIVRAGLIDVGNLSLQGISEASLIASRGDIRGNGTLNIEGDLLLRAGQIYPVSAGQFTVVAYDPADTTGSITVEGSGRRQLPLSAGGSLNLYASEISQGGTLRAPIGLINLGWDGVSTRPTDLLTGTTRDFPIASRVTLASGGETSVSAVDASGNGIVIPYGLSTDGSSWTDPTGADITARGVATKKIVVSGVSVIAEPDSNIDLRGGGDLYAFRWIQGNGGRRDLLGQALDPWSATASYDAGALVEFNGATWSALQSSTGETPVANVFWSQVPTSYAVIPGYKADYAPYAPFAGFEDSGISAGDKVYLGASRGLPAGEYTLLPARYALLSGAKLITPRSGGVVGTVNVADGSTLVGGYQFNDLNQERKVSGISSRFEVANQKVVLTRALYEDFFGSRFLKQRAEELGAAVSLLPKDSGRLVLTSTGEMRLAGAVRGGAIGDGRDALIDISTPVDIVIGKPDSGSAENALVLNPDRINRYGAESILIGGTRANGQVEVITNSIVVDNAGSPLVAPDLILASKRNLTLRAGAGIEGAGEIGGVAETLTFSGANGDGTVVRVSSDPLAAVVRTDLTDSEAPFLRIGSRASVSGAGVILDSSFGTDLHPSAQLKGDAIALSSGSISILLNDSASAGKTSGLVLAGTALDLLRNAESLSLLSYSSIDLIGAGEFVTEGLLALRSGEIRGFGTGGGEVRLGAQELLLENSTGLPGPGSEAGGRGKLTLEANVVRIGSNQTRITQFDEVAIIAPNGTQLEGSGGLSVEGDLSVSTSLLTTAPLAVQSLRAGRRLSLRDLEGEIDSSLVGGLGSQLSLQGGSLSIDSSVSLPSGLLSVTATRGDLELNGSLDVGGSAQSFYDQVRYTDAGTISLMANQGGIRVGAGAFINVAARSEGGNAGMLSVSATKGTISLGGELAAQGGVGGRDGSFSLDIGRLSSLASLNDQLNEANFNGSRAFRVRRGDVLVEGTAKAREFLLSADEGSIVVTGNIDASGNTGGTIHLAANGSLTLRPTALLTVAGEQFGSDGKGGRIALEAGTQRNGEIDRKAVLEVQAGSVLDLSVGASPELGQFAGLLHLRAPQTADGTGIQMRPVDGEILGASSILVEGYKLYDLTDAGGDLSIPKFQIPTDGATFLGSATTYDAYEAMLKEDLFRNNKDLVAFAPGGRFRVVYAPGAEIINRNGDLVLGGPFSQDFDDWDLSTTRFGPISSQGTPIIPGVLTLRAKGDLVFYNALSDGFLFTTFLYNSLQMRDNLLLPSNTQSWSYRLAAGADLASANFRQVLPLSELSEGKGSLLLGKDNGTNSWTQFEGPVDGESGRTVDALFNRYQVIRTGAGSIDVAAGRDVRLLNHFATIYTAGVQAPDWTLGGTFDPPNYDGSSGISSGLAQQDPTHIVVDEFGNEILVDGNGNRVENGTQQYWSYPAQYSWGGGHVSVMAGGNIGRYTILDGQLISDSGRQMPNNWLYRRGSVDPATGLFQRVPFRNDTGFGTLGDVASTTWWVDYSNFFQGIGALAGGDVTLLAGNDISNVDAVIPTNARMPKGKPDASKLVEFGGGDLFVKAGNNIDGGVYYVEKGKGTLIAGNEIKTNSSRTPSPGILDRSEPLAEETWLPTTLFLGKGSFDVSARGNLLLGPVANPFLLPSSVNNLTWYKTYFSTYSPDSAVNVTSLAGSVTLRQAATPQTGDAGAAVPMLYLWYNNQLLYTGGSTSTAAYQPWNRLSETTVDPFLRSFALLPPTLNVTSFSGDVNTVGDMTLIPAARGNLEILARGSVNSLRPNGSSIVYGTTWGYSNINVSDADPSAIMGIANPLGYQSIVQKPNGVLDPGDVDPTGSDFLLSFDSLFDESGSFEGEQGVLQVKQALHDSSLLHKDDSKPLLVYAGTGSISGMTLFSPKSSRILAGLDITDNAFYIQNTSDTDISVVAAGRDIVAFNANSPLRTAATSEGNVLNNSTVIPSLVNAPALAGDIQISGPGSLQVFAGRNLDLGSGGNNPDGTGVGITSIGNARNPALPFGGSQIIAGAGIGVATSLGDSVLALDEFLETLSPETTKAYLKELDLDLTPETLGGLNSEARAQIALQMFYLTLRDSGRDFNDPESPTFGTYDAGFAAIDTIFGDGMYLGDISTQARDIRSKSGGDISLFAPGGKLTLATSVIGTPQAPPGVLTESGGNISIFTHESVDIGIARIFTLRGGNEIIWSSTGDIAAGSSSKTVRSAPPTRVLIDPQSADVQTDLAGLATGGGIGVLATVVGVEPGSVDLIAPEGVVDAGDAGIRASGNLNIAATAVLNAANISFTGTSAGVPSAPTVAAPNIAGITAASNASAATTSAASEVAQQSAPPATQEEPPSIITVEVLGYGGGEEEVF